MESNIYSLVKVGHSKKEIDESAEYQNKRAFFNSSV